jgi:putative DNA primase/helicase
MSNIDLASRANGEAASPFAANSNGASEQANKKRGPGRPKACLREVVQPSEIGPRVKAQIVASPGAMDTVTQKAMRVLADSGADIFQRSTTLVRPVIGEGIDSKGHPVRVPILMAVDLPYLRKLLCAHIDWFKPDLRVKSGPVGAGFRQIDAPADIAQVILSSAGDWPFRTLAGIISTPTMRFDGSILSKTGYDPKTHLYLKTDVLLPAISDAPTKGEAEHALKLLEGLLREFPFVNKASRSVALSAILSTIARNMFDVVPAHGAKAPTPGTGKSYLFDIASAILLGEKCPVIGLSADSEGETEKRTIGAAMSGQTILNFDNVNGTLGGDALCQLIERPICHLRPLGQSQHVRIENRTIVFFNGNNCRVTGDMTRRAIVAELDARMERPAERVFQSDPVATVLADRGRYIAACMTILRAYLAAGSPKQPGAPMNSFGEWSNTVRASLLWLGQADPCETIAAARDEDPELERLSAFIMAAKDHIGDHQSALPASRIAELGTQQVHASGDWQPVHPELHAVMQEFTDRGSQVNLRRFGRWLASAKGRVIIVETLSGCFEQMCINSKFDAHKKIKTWLVETIKIPAVGDQ